MNVLGEDATWSGSCQLLSLVTRLANFRRDSEMRSSVLARAPVAGDETVELCLYRIKIMFLTQSDPSMLKSATS